MTRYPFAQTRYKDCSVSLVEDEEEVHEQVGRFNDERISPKRSQRLNKVLEVAALSSALNIGDMGA